MSLMAERMAGRMSPEDMRAMMAQMMSSMFAGMDLEQKIAFMQTMLGVCIPKLTEGLEPNARERLAAEVLGRMSEELRLAAAGQQER